VSEKRWYNCWLRHAWGQWQSAPIKTRDRYWNLAGSPYEWGEWRSASGQKQTCSVCGKYRLDNG
jgi:hypothetical protein